MIDRRTFVCTAAAAVAVAGLQAYAQPAGRVYRVGILRSTAPPKSVDRFTAESVLPVALGKMGYVIGRNLVIEWRYADGDLQRLPVLARELVQMQVDVIIAVAGVAIRAAKEATVTIPIIFLGNLDPVAAGYVASLARPGRNVTGVLIAPNGTLAAKKLELLKETVPRAKRIAVLAPEDATISPSQLLELQPAAAALGIKLSAVTVRNNDYADAFARIATTRPDALFFLATPNFMRDRSAIIDLTLKHLLPAIWEWREQVEDGGLMAYGSSFLERYQRIAEYVDRILRGANPGELPVDQPTKFGLVINLTTAKALGLTISKSLLLRADIIE